MKHPVGFFEGSVLKLVGGSSPNRLQEGFEVLPRELLREQHSALIEKAKSLDRG